jgi:hypothetical protein
MELNGSAESVTDSFTGVTVDAPARGAEAARSTPNAGELVRQADRRLEAALPSGVELSHVRGGRYPTAAQAGDLDGVPTRHPILQITRHRYGHGHLGELQLIVYHVMRRYVPTLDAAIKNRRMLEGDLSVKSDDDGLKDAIEGFIQSVPVGYSSDAPQKGLGTYLDLLSDRADEYGLAAGETRIDGSSVERLVVPNPRTLTLEDRDGDGLDELYQTQRHRAPDTQQRRIGTSDRVHTLTFSQPTEEGWPRPMAWSLVTQTEAVLRMYEAVANGWYRFGDPSMLFTEEYETDSNPPVGSEDGNQVPASTQSLANQIADMMAKRKKGKTADAFHSVKGASVEAEVIGDVDASLMQHFGDHQSRYNGLVIAASQTPRWMYPNLEMSGDGMNSSRAQNENSLAAEAAKKRDRRRLRIAREVVDRWLTLQGDARFTDRYELTWDRQSLANRKLEAEARKLEAEGDAQHVKNANVLYNSQGERRFAGDAETYLEERGVY